MPIVELAVNSMLDYVPLHPYYAVKDIYGLLAFYSVFLYLAIFSPKILGQPDNFMMATPLITPHHIVPE
jgi:ubiquinol-cytochrome c reductase cytochrome b subunit